MKCLTYRLPDPAGMRPFVANWEEVARTPIQRVYRESVGTVIDEKSQNLISALLAYPGTKPECRTPQVQRAPSDLPVIPIRFRKDGETQDERWMLSESSLRCRRAHWFRPRAGRSAQYSVFRAARQGGTASPLRPVRRRAP